MDIFLGCSIEDELPRLCIDQFGEEHVEIIHRDGALSLEEIGVLLTGIDATVSTIAFLYAVLVDYNQKKYPKNTNVQNETSNTRGINNTNETNNLNHDLEAESRRVIITKQGDMCLTGYSMEEMENVILSMYGAKNDN